MSGATVRTVTDAFYELTMSTPCISFAIDRETGKSPEQKYHAEAAERFDKILRSIRQPVADGLRDLAKALRLESEIVAFDGNLPQVHDWGRQAFLAEGDRPCSLSFFVPGPGMLSLRLCFRRLPSEATIARLQDALNALFRTINEAGP